MTSHNYAIRQENIKKFESSLAQLNDSQRSAVDAIYGPVMVIAGPGTGKTQLLALRVCNIINSTDTLPDNILCITFTDSGSYAMKTRLANFMGADAYKVNVFTYHAFCHKVIRENLEYFGDFTDLDIASDLDRKEVLMEMIDNLPQDHLLKRLKGNLYYEIKHFESLYSEIKKEGWTADHLYSMIDQYIQNLPYDDKYIYKINGKNFRKGDLKQKEIKIETDKVLRTKAAIGLFDEYNRLLRNRNLLDFDDVILMVIKAFEEHEVLLQRYQEQFQFILVDEYQDSNGSQNQLLYLLSNYEDPNIFVVGDDDQAIYRFQGANMANIEEFFNHFSPKIFILTNNYRSQQKILDVASLLIANNNERLIRNPRLNLEKNLLASGSNTDFQEIHPEILYYENHLEEELAIIQKIDTLISQGVKLNDIAVIYRKNKQSENLLKYYNSRNIPVNISKNIDAFNEPDGIRLINMLLYISKEKTLPYSGDYLLYEILSYKFFNIASLDLGKLSFAIYNENVKNKSADKTEFRQWREAIGDEDFLLSCGIKYPSEILKASDTLESILREVNNSTVQVIIEKLLTDSGLLSDILQSSEKYQRLQVVNSIFNFVKDQSAKGKLNTFNDLMDTFQKMKTFEIPIPVNIFINSEKGINFVTAHSAKGLEYDYVFMIKCTEREWLSSPSNNGFKLSFLGIEEKDPNFEDDRRLFFVGMTRARKQLYISYSKLGNNTKSLVPLSFLTEARLIYNIEAEPLKQVAEHILDYTSSLLMYTELPYTLIDTDIVDNFLSEFVMNTTALNNYMECPLKFYFINILKIPGARTAPMGYGNALHFALQVLFENKKRLKDFSHEKRLEFVLQHFMKSMERHRSHFTENEFKNHTYLGEQCLNNYLINFNESWWDDSFVFSTEETIESSINGIPIKGKLDRIMIFDNDMFVTDYKTGKYNSEDFYLPKDDKSGGKYWRQAYFYMLLLQQNNKFNKNLVNVNFEYIGDVDQDYKNFILDNDLLDILIDQIESTMNNIKEYKFNEGCDGDNCNWCNFVKREKS